MLLGSLAASRLVLQGGSSVRSLSSIVLSRTSSLLLTSSASRTTVASRNRFASLLAHHAAFYATRPVVDHEHDPRLGKSSQRSDFASKFEYIPVNEATAEKISFAAMGVSEETQRILTQNNLTHPFPIQTATYNIIREGKDLVARARTGTGKTLAFVLPLIERLAKTSSTALPRVLAVTPTRELALQVAREFSWVAPHLSTACVYGGASIVTQQRELMAGADVVVGTPGRIIDFLERGTLDLGEIHSLVLDEADHMLDIGFKDDMETILRRTPKSSQLLLFSATIPSWVERIAQQWMNRPAHIDLVGDEKTPSTIEHLGILVHPSARDDALSDIITAHMKERAIVFTETKLECNRIVDSGVLRDDARCLHGDISQDIRERTLKDFKKGVFRVLVTTDVAARGIDIPDVDLVVQISPPRNTASYIHRSGRCGRAGKSGKAIIIFNDSNRGDILNIEKAIGTKLTRIHLPSQTDLMDNVVPTTVESWLALSQRSIEPFTPLAEKLIAEHGASILARALSSITDMHHKQRSRLTGEPGFVTVQLRPKNGGSISIIRANAALQESNLSTRNGTLSASGEFAYFDVHRDVVDELLAFMSKNDRLVAEIAESLPPLDMTTVVPSNRGRYDDNSGYRGRQGYRQDYGYRGGNRGNDNERRSGGGNWDRGDSRRDNNWGRNNDNDSWSRSRERSSGRPSGKYNNNNYSSSSNNSRDHSEAPRSKRPFGGQQYNGGGSGGDNSISSRINSLFVDV